MFGILKKKLSKAVKSISKKFKKREEVIKKAKKVKKEIEKIEIKKTEEIVKEIKRKIPEAREEVEEIVEEVKPKIERAKPKERRSLLKEVAEKIVKKVKERKLKEEDLEPILNELALDLIEADVAYEVAEKIKEGLKKSMIGKEVKRGKEKEVAVKALKQSLLEILSVPEIDLEDMIKKAKGEKRPAVLLFLGFNGGGKTTSIAKLGKMLIDKDYSCVFGASDTFRSAALEQLEEHAKKINVRVIKHKYGADPAAVAFDTIAYAKANGIDFVLIDTAGRAHTNRNLMEQMQKIIRVNKPDLRILVMDSLTGNDCPVQLKIFDEAVGVDAVMLTKMDINEKGGAALSVAFQKKPILFVGVGQNYSDIKKFNKEWFVNQLLGG